MLLVLHGWFYWLIARFPTPTGLQSLYEWMDAIIPRGRCIHIGWTHTLLERIIHDNLGLYDCCRWPCYSCHLIFSGHVIGSLRTVDHCLVWGRTNIGHNSRERNSSCFSDNMWSVAARTNKPNGLDQLLKKMTAKIIFWDTHRFWRHCDFFPKEFDVIMPCLCTSYILISSHFCKISTILQVHHYITQITEA